jgi:peptidoglycan-associated lipoprotein
MAVSHKLRAASGALMLTVGALALSACGAKPPAELPPEPGPAVSTTTTTTDTQMAAPSGPVAGTPADFVAVQRGRDTIYFGLDKYNIDPVAGAGLRSQAEWLLKYPGRRATLEGHADERGTRDYNLALGERRANAAKNYLVSLGIDAARLTTVSYGKERPVDTASSEEAWAKNRRAVTVVVE